MSTQKSSIKTETTVSSYKDASTALAASEREIAYLRRYIENLERQKETLEILTEDQKKHMRSLYSIIAELSFEVSHSTAEYKAKLRHHNHNHNNNYNYNSKRKHPQTHHRL